MIFTADLDGEWYDVYADKQLFAFSAVLPSLSLVARDTLPNNQIEIFSPKQPVLS